MADESSRKTLLRQALSSQSHVRIPALTTLSNSTLNVPTSFILHILTRAIVSSDQTTIVLTVRIIKRSISLVNAESTTKKKLNACISSCRKASPSTRDALSLAKLAAALINVSPISSVSLELLIVAIASIEASPAPSTGPQRRGKEKALSTAYRHGSRAVVAALSSVQAQLFSIADGFAKAPRESVAALGLLAPAFQNMDDEHRERLLILIATICVKVGVVAADVIRVANVVLAEADHDVVLGKVIPIFDRALLREPQLALPACCHFFQGLVGIDLSPVVDNSLVPAVIQAVKSSDDKSRLHAVSLIGILGRSMKSEKCLIAAITGLCVVLRSARYAYQKVSTLDAISKLLYTCSPTKALFECASSQIVAWLSSKKESNIEARVSAIRSLITMMSVVRPNTQELGEALCDFFSFCSDVLTGKAFPSDQRALLTAMAEALPLSAMSEYLILKDFLRKDVPPALEAILMDGTVKTKIEDSLRAATILSFWDACDTGKVLLQNSKAWKFIGDINSSPVFQETTALSTVSEVTCAIRCCVWMVRVGHESKRTALASLVKYCLDSRNEVSTAAQKEILNFQRNGSRTVISDVFSVLWETQFSSNVSETSVAKSYDFDDGRVFAERLGHTLLATVLPNLPLENLPLILLACNHPRLCPEASLGRSIPRSRYWLAIERHLQDADPDGDVDSTDWLEHCLIGISGENGLQNGNVANAIAAVNALCMLADGRNNYSTRVLRRMIVVLRPLMEKAANLSTEALQALEIMKKSEEAAISAKSTESSRSGLGRKKAKKPVGSLNPRQNQQKQAASDRARAAAASASAAAEKTRAAKEVATAASNTIQLSRVALLCIRYVARTAPYGVHNLSAALLSLILPLARLEVLEQYCRSALTALTESAGSRLRSISVEIANSLYGLERNFDVQKTVSLIVYSLKDIVPPAFSAEDFSLISPILRAALLRDPNAEDQGIMSGKRGSTKRRDTIAVVKAAALVLVEHCKPEAVDAAVAAAACRAGAWAVRVLEREDGAFAAAADALALLAGTALTPGTESLSQVLEGVVSGKSSVRDAALAALYRIPQLTMPTVECPRDSALGRSLWLARFDPDESNAELAIELWENYNHPLFVPEDVPAILGLLAHSEADIRLMSSKAIATCLCGSENEETRNQCIPKMFTLYLRKLPKHELVTASMKEGVQSGSPPLVKRGREKSKSESEEVGDEGWKAREGVAMAIENMALSNALKPKDITICFSFLAGRGLGDHNDIVRARMSKAATAVVEAAGALGPAMLLPMIEKQLNYKISSSTPKDEVLHADRTRENLVMSLGAVAGFLPPEDPRVRDIADQVIRSAMETPSEVVQNAAARCLVPLAKAAIGIDREMEVTKTLMGTVWSESSSYGERRGAAYALAGISGGLGLKFLKRSGIITEVETAVAEKSPRRRQGAFILIETNAILLGRLFEPYAVATIPFLLSCMGDSVVEVRNACWAAAQASMSELSSQGVKMILPSLLGGLKDRQWRTKAGSAEVLGAMAFCAPRQLAQCLPQVVPQLAEALADAHPRVVSSAESAINRIAAVVRSPEVRKLSPFLLAALRDPAGKTRGAIDAMLGSEFVHAIDAASLALLIPPLHRGLRDRSPELKKRAAAIVGSMCNNVSNHFDVVPYLGLLLPALRVTLLDAIPDVRRTSARALGALSVSLGEQGMLDIVPWLVNALLGISKPSVGIHGERVKVTSAVVSSSAERAGAAMGLAEVAASMSDRRLEDVLNSVLVAGHSSAEAREGGLMLLASMPRALGDRFEGKLGRALSAILVGLADDSDSVREAALDAGRNLVSAYAKSSLEHLLPELLIAMREKLWRIRQAATRLLGDMLLVIAGAQPERPNLFGATDTAGNDTDVKDSENNNGENGEEDNGEGNEEEEEDFESPEQAAAAMTTESAMKAIEEALGFERRNEVLAALYIIRCDVSVRVRQTGMQVWKSVVVNTPRVLREIMPSAVKQIVDGLGDEDEERRAAAGKTLSDLSQKLGDRVVPEVLPALRTGLLDKSCSDRIRRGACEGLGELVLASPKDQLEQHADDLIDAVYQGLTDELSSVRATAAQVFASLLKPLGTVAVDAVVPRLIAHLSSHSSSQKDQEEEEKALDSLKQIMVSSGTRLMAIVVPRLLSERPLKTSSARALATAATVAEGGFVPYIADVVDAVVDSIEVLNSSEPNEALESTLAAIAEGGPQAVKTLLDEVFLKFNEGYPERRVAASRTCAGFCRSASPDRVATSSVTLLEIIIRQLADTDEDAAKAALEALQVLSDVVPNGVLSAHIPVIRQSLRVASTGITVHDSSAKIVALQMRRAPAPFVPIFSDGLLNGTPELREQAALAIGELVELSSTSSLGPFVIKLGGPLIRVVSGRFPWQVKAAILKSLLLLLKKGSSMLRAFVPQLQSTFVKSLSDSSRLVRVRGCAALGALVPIQSRLEPLLNDLVNLGRGGVTVGSRTAAFHACSQVFRFGKKLPETSFTTIAENIAEGLEDENEEVSKAAGRSLGFLSGRSEGSEQYESLIGMVHGKLKMEDLDYSERVNVVRALGAMFATGKEVPGVSYKVIEKYVLDIYELFDSSIDPLLYAACATTADIFVLLSQGESMHVEGTEHKRTAVLKLSETAEFDERAEVRMAALNALKSIVHIDEMVLEISAATLVCCAAATNTGIKECAERVMKKAFLTGRDQRVKYEQVDRAKAVLDEEDGRFIDRRIPKLRALPESEDERD